jgi:hypothetical protein
LAVAFACGDDTESEDGAGSGGSSSAAGSNATSGSGGRTGMAGRGGAGTGAAAGRSAAGASGSTAGRSGGGGASASGGRGAGAGGSSGQGGGPTKLTCSDDPEMTADECPACARDDGCDAPDYTDNGDGTVDSSCCGLTWQKMLAAEEFAWAGADAYCKGLDLAGGGWRLPTIAELLSLVEGSSSPRIDTDVFPGTGPDSFWSSSAYEATAGFAWFVTFGDGSAGGFQLANMGRVRCVR